MDQFAQEIARRLLELDAPNVSRPLDLLLDAMPPFLNYGRWCEARFLELADHLRSVGETRRLAWVLPVSTTPSLHPIRIDIGDIREPFSPARVYLLSNPTMFTHADEEYRAALPLSRKRPDIGAIYRSFRDPSAADAGEEFSNDIYLWVRRACDESGPVN